MSIRQQMPGQVSVRLLFPQVNPRFELPGVGDEAEHPPGQQWRWSTFLNGSELGAANRPRPVDSSGASAHRERPVLRSIS